MARSLVDLLEAWLDDPEVETPSDAQLNERRNILANARVGYYADRGGDLAKDLAAAGAPKDVCDAANAGEFDSEQRTLVGEATPKTSPAQGEPDAGSSGEATRESGSKLEPPPSSDSNPVAPDGSLVQRNVDPPVAEKAPEDSPSTPTETSGG